VRIEHDTYSFDFKRYVASRCIDRGGDDGANRERGKGKNKKERTRTRKAQDERRKPRTPEFDISTDRHIGHTHPATEARRK